MQDQKLDNLLNLAMDANEEELDKSPELKTGYTRETKSWDLIVKFTKEPDFSKWEGVRAEILLGGYGILTVPEDLIVQVASIPEIEYVEKPKRLFFSLSQAKAASCITLVQEGPKGLSGVGVITAVIDSGIDYFHEDFRNGDGSTRILALWDQSLGRVYTEEEINEALGAGSREEGRKIVPSTDASGHGTAVAGIAAGNGRESGGRYRGVAYESSLLIVKLGVPSADGFPRTTELMRALDFVVRQGVERQMPVAINLSFGNTYGSHDGTSLVETFLDTAISYGRNIAAIGTGNEGSSGVHTSGVMAAGKTNDIELSIGTYETGFGLQLWKSYADIADISLVTPSGDVIGPINQTLGTHALDYGDTRILIYYGKPSPYSQAQEIYFDFIPKESYIDSGIWKIRLEPEKVAEGSFDLWLPSRAVLNEDTRFLFPTPEITLTIPSTSFYGISVGAYDDAYQSYADFSGRGYTRVERRVKPEIAAPGVGIITARSGGGYEAVTGTSFAAPFVTGSGALMMEWGIVRGSDPYLYGEKVKAYLIRGARQIPGFSAWPNPQLGYGILCLKDSFP